MQRITTEGDITKLMDLGESFGIEGIQVFDRLLTSHHEYFMNVVGIPESNYDVPKAAMAYATRRALDFIYFRD